MPSLSQNAFSLHMPNSLHTLLYQLTTRLATRHAVLLLYSSDFAALLWAATAFMRPRPEF